MSISEGDVVDKYNLINDDCLKILPEIPDNSVDMVLADLPYGTTVCDWDSIIPLDKLWEQYKRIGKDDTPYVFTASQPFTTKLIQSNMDWFKYCWIWNKTRKTGHLMAKKQPLRNHEEVVVFYKDQSTYNPQGVKSCDKVKKNTEGRLGSDVYGKTGSKKFHQQNKTNYPTTVTKISSEHNVDNHPTQKPVALFEYLIKTYTNEGDLVLDNVMGSGTAGVACQKTDRLFLGIEQDEEYFEISKERIVEAKNTDWERVEGIEKWTEFDGIGKKTAETLYDELGNVEASDMDKLEQIDGIGSKTAQSIREAKQCQK